MPTTVIDIDQPIIFVWDNFGPMHMDRLEAVADAACADVKGLELFEQSSEYDWTPTANIKKTTLWPKVEKPSFIRRSFDLIKHALRQPKSTWFICNYDRPEILTLAITLRLLGNSVFVMGCSKYDDKPRVYVREKIKRMFLLPYQGAIGSGVRSKEYFHHLGLAKSKIVGEYNSLSRARVRNLAATQPAESHPEHFTVIARCVPKKAIHIALKAYAKARTKCPDLPALHICGSGPLEDDLKAFAASQGIADFVVFRGFIQAPEIAATLSNTVALILSSVEEQFGNVVIEAQTLGVPVILSNVCGACDTLVEDGKNGFVVQSGDVDGFAASMLKLWLDNILRNKMQKAAKISSAKGDVQEFVKGVAYLIQKTS